MDTVRDRWPLVGRRPELRRLEEALTAGHSAVVVGPAGSGRSRILRATAGLLAPRRGYRLAGADDDNGHGGAARIVHVVDDADRLGPETADDLDKQLRSGHVGVLSVRGDRSPPHWIGRLWHDGIAVRLELPPLSLEDVDAMLRAGFRGHVDPAAGPALRELSAGRPRLVEELATGPSGCLRHDADADVWRLREPAAGPGLRAMLEDALSICDPGISEVLEVLAVTGPLGLELLDAIVGSEAVTAAERAGLAAIGSDDSRRTVSLVPPAYGLALAERMGRISRARIAQRAAVATAEGPSRRRGDSARLALWRLQADGRIDAELARDAATDAPSPRLAEELARSGGRTATPSSELQLALGRALRRQGRRGDAETVLADAASEHGVTPARVTMMRAVNLIALSPGDATELLEGSPGAGARRALVAAGSTLASGDVQGALERLDDIDETDLDTRVRPWHRALGLVGAALAGRWAQAAGSGSATPPSIAGSALAFLAVEYGDLEQAATLAEAEHHAALATGRPELRAWAALILGRTRLAEGRPLTAARSLGEAASLFTDLGQPGPRRWAYGLLAVATAARPGPAGRLLRLDEILTERRGAPRLFEPDSLRGRAWLAAALGRPAMAQSMLATAASMASDLGQHSIEAAALHDLVRLGHAPLVARRLRDARARLQSPLARAYDRHAAALQDPDPGRALSVADDFVEIGATLLGAEAAAQAAHRYGAGGDRAHARVAARRATALLRACEEARTPALAALPTVASLTPREREVAELAAEGQSNREIAARLHLSVRTVENHLHRAYGKLGISDRRRLGVALGLVRPDG